MVDWEGLKSLEERYPAEFTLRLRDIFPAILAAHEKDQRVILAAEKLRDSLLRVRAWDVTNGFQDEIKLIDAALAEYDKAKEKS